MEKVKALKSESCDWFLIPNSLVDEFYKDMENCDMVDSGEFDNKWGRYMTGGDLNRIQLYAEL